MGVATATGLMSLQKPSTKTRIETQRQHDASNCKRAQCCKSRLQKQGLKHAPIAIRYIRFLPGCKSRLQKQGLKHAPIAIRYIRFLPGCKSRLQKQGLKH